MSKAVVDLGNSVIVYGDKFFLNLALISKGWTKKTLLVFRFCSNY